MQLADTNIVKRKQQDEKEQFLDEQVNNQNPSGPRSNIKKCLKWLMYLIVALIILLMCQIVIVRMYYHYRIYNEIKVKVKAFEEQHPSFKNNTIKYIDGMKQPSSSIQYLTCDLAYKMSHLRQQILTSSRNISIYVMFVSILFDQARHMHQHTKVDRLLAEKSCWQVLEGSYTSNYTVDMVVSIMSVLLLLILMYFGAKVCKII